MRSLIIPIILIPSAFLHAQDNWGWPQNITSEDWFFFCSDYSYGIYFSSISSNDSLIFVSYDCFDSSGFYWGIAQSHFTDGEWQPLEVLPLDIDEEYPIPIFYFDQQDTLLYFVSEMSGGYGGSDIWASQFINNSWTVPYNLGPPINSAESETSPSMPDDDSGLYFTRGADIMYADKINGQYTEPVSLPLIINSDLTETHPRISRDGQRLYFNRYGSYYYPDTTMVSYYSNGQWQYPTPLNSNINCTHSVYCPTIPCSSYGPSFTGDGTKMYYSHFDMWGISCDPLHEIWVSELATDIEEEPAALPSALSLSAYPNPFNNTTNITVAGNLESLSEIAIYDITGRRIKSFAPASQITWDGTDIRGAPASSGIYFLKATTGDYNKSIRITLLK